MLSSTAGYTKRSRYLRRRRDETSLRSALCPALSARGFCRAHEAERRLRAEIAAEKESELRRRATELCALQAEVLHSCGDKDNNNNNNNTANGASNASGIASAMAELRAEPSYRQWSLEGAVVDRMALLRRRRCPFAHHRMGRGVLQSQRVCGEKVRGKYEKRAAAERRKVFAGLSPLQQCVVCLLWQRTCEVPPEVLGERATHTSAEKESNNNSEDETDSPNNTNNYSSNNNNMNECDNSNDGSIIHGDKERCVTVTFMRPSLGVVDLSSLPALVAFIAQHPEHSVIRAETIAFFTHDHTVIVPASMTDKQVDLSTSAGAHELVDAIAWAVQLTRATPQRKRSDTRAAHRNRKSRHNKAKVNPEEQNNDNNNNDDDDNNDEAEDEANDACGDGESAEAFLLRSLALRRCGMTSADPLIGALRKRCLDATLLALDLSENRLQSLRFLFALRAHFAERLLRLSLADNPITRKPGYRAQVRGALPRLTSLDGANIRRPPLPLPRPKPSHTLIATNPDTQSRHVLSDAEFHAVMDSLERFVYAWETRRVPCTAAAEAEAEEELDEDNFHQRYLHPSATFTMSVQEDLSFFNEREMRLATEVEDDDGFAGMRLSPIDLRDIRVFDVAMKGNSRNLQCGRSAVHRLARDSLSCYTAYRFTVYPERLKVRHNLSGAVTSVVKVTDTRPVAQLHTVTEAPHEKKKQKQNTNKKKKMRKESRTEECSDRGGKAFAATHEARKPAMFVVTFHGIMTWRAPSMRGGQCIPAAYDRVVTFVENALPTSSAAEPRACAPLLVFNDTLHLRTVSDEDRAKLVLLSESHVTRLVIEFGLEACSDGPLLVRSVLECASSPAAARAALEALVFGNAMETEEEEEEVWNRSFDIFSLLLSNDEAESAAAPRRVMLKEVKALVPVMNARHTVAFSKEGKVKATQ